MGKKRRAVSGKINERGHRIKVIQDIVYGVLNNTSSGILYFTNLNNPVSLLQINSGGVFRPADDPLYKKEELV